MPRCAENGGDQRERPENREGEALNRRDGNSEPATPSNWLLEVFGLWMNLGGVRLVS